MASHKSIVSASKAIAMGGNGFSGAPHASGAWGNGAASIANSGAYTSGWAAAYGQPSPGLPRPPQIFTDGAFGPQSPILPVPINEPPEGSVFAEPRLFEQQVGWNLPTGTPGSEGIKLADFSTLKTLADLYSVARACIQLRKNEIRGIEWDILPTRDASKAMRGAPNLARSFGARRSEAIKFFKRPDPDFFNWASFLDALCEEVFVYDALSILIRPKWSKGHGAGLLGSDLDSISLLSGPTIRPLLGLQAERPRPPAPAYQQYLYGVPRVDIMSLVTERDLEGGLLSGSEMGQFRADQLLYLPMVPRRWTPYGFPPIERALIPVMAGLQKQGFQLDYYREGSVPAVYISPGGANSNMTPNQIRELQDALNALAGDPAWKHKIIVLPADSKVMPQKQAQLADQFDEIVMNQVCMAFDVQPMELGIMPKVSTSVSPGAANQMSKACYADDVEVLTERGWLKFSEVSTEDNFATRNMETKVFEWQQATAFHEYDFDGQLVSFKSANGRQKPEDGLNLRVTDNHRMLLEWQRSTSRGGGKFETIKEAGQIKQAKVSIPQNSAWVGETPATVKFGKYEWAATDFAFFLGAYIAEGHLGRQPGYYKKQGEWTRRSGGHIIKSIHVSQQEKSKGFKRYHEVLTRMLGREPGYNNGGFRFACADLWDYLNPLGHAEDKYIPTEVKNWGAKALEAFLEGYLLGDGYLENGVWRAKTVSPRLAGDLQEIAQKLGGTASVSVKQPKDTTIRGRVVLAENCLPIYLVRFNKSRTRRVSVSREDYAGKVYCVTVPNGILYVRVNGHALWCGNSQNIHERKATKPFLSFVADIMNVLLQEVCGQTDMRFMFEGLEEGEDEQVKTEILISQVGAALRSIDEAREELDLQPWGLPETSDPGWATSTGWTPLTEAIAAARTGSDEGNIFSGQAPTPDMSLGAPQAAGASADPSTGADPGSPASPGSMEDASPTAGVEVPNSDATATPGHAAAQAATDNTTQIPLPMAKNEHAALFKGNDSQELRDKRVEKIMDKVEQQLTQLIDAVRDGKIDRNKAVALATAFLTAGYKTIIDKAVGDAAEDLGLDYTGRESVDNLAWKYGEDQRQWLDGLIQKATEDPDKKLRGRIGLYAQTLEAVYNKSYAQAAQESGKNWRITWRLGSGENCQNCIDRDGDQFTFDTLPGIPGEGAFGGDLCQGGPNCHCSLDFEETNQKDTSTKPFDTGKPDTFDLNDLHQRVADIANERAGAPGKRPAQLLKPEDITDDDVKNIFASKTRAILSELEAMTRHVKKGRSVSDWAPKHLTSDVLARVNEFMAKGSDVDSAVQMVRQQRLVASDGQVYWKDIIGDWDPNRYPHGSYEPHPHDANDIFHDADHIPSTKAAKDLDDPNPVAAEHIYNMLLSDFDPKGLKWVKDVEWVGPIEVPLERIDFDDAENWAAAHDTAKVAKFVKMLKKGKKLKPGISVRQTEGDSRIKIVDGHHRALACREVDTPYITYLAFVPEGDNRWEQTHSFQYAKADGSNGAAQVARPAVKSDGKVSKESVNYRTSDNPNKHCGNCSMFLPSGSCTLVEGFIKPEDVCDEWDPIKADKVNQPFGGGDSGGLADGSGPNIGGSPTEAVQDPAALQTEEELMNNPELVQFFETGAGASQIKWGTTGDISRCVTLATQTLGLENAQTFCQIRYSKMTGQQASGLIHEAPSMPGGNS